MLASDFGTGEVFWSLLWFSVLVIWVYLVIIVVSDVLRSHELSGVTKFLWLLAVLALPFLGVFAYFIVRGHKITEHHQEDAVAAHVVADAYVRQAAAGAGTGLAGELARLDDLRRSGVITDAEFEHRKAQLLQG